MIRLVLPVSSVLPRGHGEEEGELVPGAAATPLSRV